MYFLTWLCAIVKPFLDTVQYLFGHCLLVSLRTFSGFLARYPDFSVCPVMAEGSTCVIPVLLASIPRSLRICSLTVVRRFFSLSFLERIYKQEREREREKKRDKNSKYMYILVHFSILQTIVYSMCCNNYSLLFTLTQATLFPCQITSVTVCDRVY